MLKKSIFAIAISIMSLIIFSQSVYAYKLISFGHDSAYIKMWNPSENLSSTYQVPYARAKNAWYNTATDAQIVDEWNDHQHQIYDRQIADTWNGLYSVSWYNSNGTARSFTICLNDTILRNKSYNYVQSVIVHEFGHVLGLDDDPPEYQSIMRSDRTRETMITPQQDDVDGVNDFYN